MRDTLNKIRDSLANLELDSTLNLVDEALKSNVSVKDIIDSLAEGMKIVGERYENGDYFVADLIVAGEIFKEVMNILRPRIIAERKSQPIGRVVIGTVYGDVHDVGKNLVAIFLEAAGFEVIDLGVDVPPQKFIEAVKQYKPDIVGMSALLTTTMVHMKDVIESLKKEGLKDKVKVIVGGAPLTEEFAKSIGADAYGENAFKAVEICRKMVEELRKKT
ncbi:MAG: corrinoid protein [Ignisphaera sp.]|uniref:Cobalamin-binding protein n=1 Tax=Ignisphaera aggregans TaxID=334771 RepID=A0A7C4NLM7_9CREN